MDENETGFQIKRKLQFIKRFFGASFLFLIIA
jgi:hypothetical protein